MALRSSLCLALSLAIASAAPAPLRLDGLVAAVFSPFDDDGKLNMTVVPLQQDYLNATGVNWVFVSGTTGESLKLSKSERMALMDAWVKTGTNVIMHVGADCLSDAKEMAVHAAEAGAKAIGAMPPVFFKPANAEALALTMAAVCNVAPKLPCYYYHIPSMTGVALPMIDFVKAIEPLSPNFAGVKYTGLYTSPGFMDAERVMAYKGGKYEVFSGREEMMLEALSLGIKGHVGSQFNFAGDLFNGIREHFAAEGLTRDSMAALRARQLTATELVGAWASASPTGVDGSKYFQNLAGVPVGPSRLPSIPIDSNSASALKDALGSFCAANSAAKFRVCQHF